jgi:peptidoglycan/LPS O-acetylase OafA/YrhL
LLGEQSPMKNVGNMGLSYYFFTAFDTLTFMGSSTVFGAWISNNYPSWSISAEMISYVVFGLVLLLLSRVKYAAFAGNHDTFRHFHLFKRANIC